MALTSGNQITLHYQPVLDLSSGQCRRAEALVRWQHSTLGAIAPGDFIPAAERTALMRPLTDLVLDLAVAQLKRWQQEGINLQLSVNISVRDLEDARFVESVRSLLSLHEVPASALELEVTEGALMTCPQTIVTHLEELRRLGISIALDDFGTGQSSLSYLAKLPADTLKLDRTFANDMKRSSRTAVAVRAVIDAWQPFRAESHSSRKQASRRQIRAHAAGRALRWLPGAHLRKSASCRLIFGKAGKA